MFAFLKTGFTTEKGELDDARVSAFMLVLSYIYMGLHGSFYATDLAAFVQAWGIGAAAMAGGIGIWFGQRGNN